ncbi:hypothetical protein ACH5RR_022513 [Cinchona calisaya]|uniref:Uncharacterized protein n=1 Tax=Cinchona calisaya TaxID=153742 RepID=A0ABD2Z804_9GENT
MEKRPHIRLHPTLPHSHCPNLPHTHLHAPPLSTPPHSQPHHPPPHHRRAQPHPLPPLPHHGLGLHSLHTPPNPQRPQGLDLGRLLPSPSDPAYRAHFLLGPDFLYIQDSRIHRHPFNYSQWVPL